jgi:molybdenum cofactor biosynthesis protein B
MSRTAAEHKARAPKRLGFAILTISTSRHREASEGKEVEDPSGSLAERLLKNAGHKVIQRTLVSDNTKEIKEAIQEAVENQGVQAILSCGGTGIAPTDITVETVGPMLEKEIPGFGEIFRWISYEQIGSAAILTRAIAGVIHGKAVFCLPGSPQAVELAVRRLIATEAAHIVEHAREGSRASARS